MSRAPDAADPSSADDDLDPDGSTPVCPAVGPIDLRAAVVGVTVLALAVRLVGLGRRTLHWDEGRVGYWALRYHETGVHAYRPIVHGPFLPIVTDPLFSLLGPSAFAFRLPVAVVGGCLPLVAWAFRDRLRPGEVLALAALLAANPLLVYYSRFARNDVLVAAFATAALAFVVVGHDRADLRYLPAAGVALGLAFATKENALVYVACFAGALALVGDHRLLRASRAEGGLRAVVARRWPAEATAHLERLAPATPGEPGSGPDPDADPNRPPATDGGVLAGWRPVVAGRSGAGLRRLIAAAAIAGLAFLVVVVAFYAPRPDLWRAVAAPGRLPGVVEAATVESAGRFAEGWLGADDRAHDYLPFLVDFLETVAYGAPVVAVLAAVGFVVDGYLAGRRRTLVAFATYWGLASVVGYPIATDIQAPWAVVHAVVPLSIPAAVGVAAVGRAAVDAADVRFEGGAVRADGGGPDRDLVAAALACLLLVAAGGGTVALNVDYYDSADPDDREVLQWAQPDNDLRTTMATVDRVAAATDGTDVLFVGATRGTGPGLYVRNESSADAPPPGRYWTTRLPLPWYLERANATVDSTPPGVSPATALADPPPVVIAYGRNASAVAAELPAHEASRHRFKLWGEEVVVFVDPAAVPDADATAASTTRRRRGARVRVAGAA